LTKTANFAGWMSDAEIEAYYEQLAEEAVAIAEQKLKRESPT
jgi:hypothetical protein